MIGRIKQRTVSTQEVAMSTHHSSKIEQINRFEHPMNESMRLSLRIEALYSQVFLAMEQKQRSLP